MFGNLGELAGLMKNFQNLQARMKEMKEELSQLELTGRSCNGELEITLSGDMNPKKVTVSPTLLSRNDPAAVEEAVYEALSSALSQVKAEAAGRLSEATGGLKIPGFPA